MIGISYDPTKKRGEYDRGEWIQIQLAARLSDKELHTTSIGKMSFTATDGTDDGDYEHAESTMRLITDAGNTANKCGLLPSELLEQRDELLRIGLSFLDKYLNLSYKGSDDPLEKEVKEFSSAFRKISGK